MSYENVRSLSFLPTADEPILRNRFVSLVAAGTVQAPGGVGARSMGVALEDSPDSDVAGVDAAQAAAAIPITILDGSKQEVEAGVALAVGNIITTNAAGQAIVAIATNQALGTVLSAAAAIGETVTFISSNYELTTP